MERRPKDQEKELHIEDLVMDFIVLITMYEYRDILVLIQTRRV